MRRVGLVMVVAVACAVGLPAVAPPAAGAVLQVTIPAPDFDNDGIADLAVGAPGEDVGAATDAGAVNVLYGSAGGLGGGQVLTQGAAGVPGASESFDRFGTALATGSEQLTQQDAAGTVEAGDRFGEALSESFFFLNDVLEDVAVGAPGETVDGRGAAGAGSALFGAEPGGLGDGGSQFFFQGGGGLGGVAEAGDLFGDALS